MRTKAEALHVAVCQAVALMNRTPEVARCAEAREAHTLLRQALITYAAAAMLPEPETKAEFALRVLVFKGWVPQAQVDSALAIAAKFRAHDPDHIPNTTKEKTA
jgi:hypothetical protein